MSSLTSVLKSRITVHLDRSLSRRRVRLLSRKFRRAAHTMAPTVAALSFAGIAHVAQAQGTISFSGAQTFMQTVQMGSAAVPLAVEFSDCLQTIAKQTTSTAQG